MRPILAAACLFSLSCGLVLQFNSTAARTLPFHAHGDDIAKYSVLAKVQQPANLLDVPVGRFVAYYPRPAALAYDPEGMEGTSWSEITLPELPEDVLPKLLGKHDERVPGGTPRLYGVVTDFQWYQLQEGEDWVSAGGRLVTRLSLVADGGNVLYEAEKTTEGRAESVDFLYRTHVMAWLQDPEMAQAIVRARGLP